MSQRILRTVPAALLMTTALCWSLPASAQGTGAPGASGGTPPSTSQKVPAPATSQIPPAEGTRGAVGGAEFGGGTSALPADLRPAMPASASAPATTGAPQGGLNSGPSGATKRP